MMGLLLALVTSAYGYEAGLVDSAYSQIGVDQDSVGMAFNGNENIDLFSGQLSLSYTDYCIPGTFGLDMCVVRTYSSKVLSESLSETNVDVWAGAGWSINPGGRLYFDPYVLTYAVWIELPGGPRQKAVVVDSAGDYYRVAGNANALPDMTSSYNEQYITPDFTFVYKTGGNEYTAIRTDGTRFVFDITSSHADGWYYAETIENHYGDTITVAYDTGCTSHANGSGAVDTLTDAHGRVIDFETDTSCYVESFEYTDYDGTAREFTYVVDSDGNLESAKAATGETTTYTYDTAYTGELTGITYPTGGTTEYTYDTIEFLQDYTAGSGEYTYFTRVIDDKTVTPDSSTTWYWEFTYDDYATSSTSASSGTRINSVEEPDGAYITHEFYTFGYSGSGSSATKTDPNLIGKPATTSWYDSSSDTTPTRSVTFDYSDSGGTNGVNGPEISYYGPGFHSAGTAAPTRHVVPYEVSTSIDGVEAHVVRNGAVSDGDYDIYGNPLYVGEAAYSSYFSTAAVYWGAIRETEYAWASESTLESYNLVRLPSYQAWGSATTSDGTLDDLHGEVDMSYSTSTGTEGWLEDSYSYTYPSDNASDDVWKSYTWSVDTSAIPTWLEVEIDHGGERTATRTFEYGALTELSWDDSGTDVVVVTRVVDEATGLVTSETDENGQTTTYEYDEVGRLDVLTPPTDDEWRWDYDLTATPPTVTVQREWTGTETLLTLDGIGQVISTETDNGSGTTSIVEVEYDHAGRASKTYEPTDGSTPVAYGSVSYDSSGRPVSQLLSDGSTSLTTTTSYSFPDVSVTDAEGYVHSSTLDGYGATDSASPALGATTSAWTQPAWSSLTCPDSSTVCAGTLVDTTDGSDSIRQIRYVDGGGRMWMVHDEQSDYTKWLVDSAGDVVCQADANGDMILWEYDFRGRVKSEHHETHTGTPTCAVTTQPAVRNYYDGALPKDMKTLAPANVEGRLSGVDHAAGSRVFSYDEEGRIERVDDLYDQGPRWFTQEVAYDLEGNLDEHSLDYGTWSFTTSTTYGFGGRVESIEVHGTGKETGKFRFDVVDDVTYLPNGMVDTLEYASGVSSRFTLDDYGRLQTISTSGVAGSAPPGFLRGHRPAHRQHTHHQGTHPPLRAGRGHLREGAESHGDRAGRHRHRAPLLPRRVELHRLPSAQHPMNRSTASGRALTAGRTRSDRPTRMERSMREISEKQAQAVASLPGPERYSHFVKVVADTAVAWGLWQDGWAMVGTDDGQQAFPLWPARIYAERCAIGEWAGYEPAEIDVDDLVGELLPRLETDGVLPAVFMTPDARAVTPSIDTLLADLRRELDRF